MHHLKAFLVLDLMKCNLSQLGSGPITDKKEHTLNSNSPVSGIIRCDLVLDQCFFHMNMLLEKEQYLMKSHHFVLRSRHEPSTRNAFSPSNRKSISRYSFN